VLKLIYHNAVFGPIHLEYDQPAIRVGRSEDNDLVLRHPSVEPYHCILVFQDEKVIWLPPDSALRSEGEPGSLSGPAFALGDQISIGELQFHLAHSAQTVAIPGARPPEAVPEKHDGAGAADGTSQSGYFCSHCRLTFQQSEVKRVGLVGRSKRCLCPKCSGLLDVEPDEPAPSPPRQKQRLGLLARGRTA
jgi:hypothetical protein